MYPNYPMQPNARNGSIQSDNFRHPARSSLRSTSMVLDKFIMIFVLFIPSSQYTSKEGKKKKRKCPNQPSDSSVSEPWASAWPPISSTKATPCTATMSSLSLSSGFRRQGASRRRRFGVLQRTSHFMYAWLPLLRRHRRRFLGRRVLCNVCMMHDACMHVCMQILVFSSALRGTSFQYIYFVYKLMQNRPPPKRNPPPLLHHPSLIRPLGSKRARHPRPQRHPLRRQPRLRRHQTRRRRNPIHHGRRVRLRAANRASAPANTLGHRQAVSGARGRGRGQQHEDDASGAGGDPYAGCE